MERRLRPILVRACVLSPLFPCLPSPRHPASPSLLCTIHSVRSLDWLPSVHLGYMHSGMQGPGPAQPYLLISASPTCALHGYSFRLVPTRELLGVPPPRDLSLTCCREAVDTNITILQGNTERMLPRSKCEGDEGCWKNLGSFWMGGSRRTLADCRPVLDLLSFTLKHRFSI